MLVYTQGGMIRSCAYVTLIETAHSMPQVYGHFTFSSFLTLERKSGSDLGRHGDFKDITLRIRDRASWKKYFGYVSVRYKIEYINRKMKSQLEFC